jgi:SAM-dependent methyltransferase
VSSAEDTDRLRAEMRERWEQASTGWGKRAELERDWAMPVSSWMLDHLGLQPGQRVLELAAGAGDTGFLAAELIRPGGTLICSDGAEGMLEVARRRADALGIRNVEFKLLELEWIDLEAASVDAVLCRWGLMFPLDPEAAFREIRRVLRPRGRLALAAWDERDLNPWMTIPQQALIQLGHLEPPDPTVPSPFSLSAPGRLEGLFEDAGFVEWTIDAVTLTEEHDDVEVYVRTASELSPTFSGPWRRLDESQRAEVRATVAELAVPYTGSDGRLALPGRTLVAVAEA